MSEERNEIQEKLDQLFEDDPKAAKKRAREAAARAKAREEAKAAKKKGEESGDEDEDEDEETSFGAALLKALVVTLIVIVITGCGAGYYLIGRYHKNLEPALMAAEEQIFTVEKGWSLTKISQELESAGLIKDAKSFATLGDREGEAENLKAGRYILSASMSGQEILTELVNGQLFTMKFTIPEGYTTKQICRVFAERGISDEASFWEAVKSGSFDYAFLEGAPEDETRLEGFLFPDTYTIEVDEPVESVLNRMLARFQEILNDLPENQSGLDLRSSIILASIVQNEIKLDEERPVAAAVFLNRLDINMLLQSCSTVQFLFDEPKATLLNKDLEIESPYNTYLNKGLPPGPISNPGLAALEAVWSPADTDYLYFVAKDDGSGGHYFSKTLEEHNRYKAQARENRASQ